LLLFPKNECEQILALTISAIVCQVWVLAWGVKSADFSTKKSMVFLKNSEGTRSGIDLTVLELSFATPPSYALWASEEMPDTNSPVAA
jgi:hypothetical protein